MYAPHDDDDDDNDNDAATSVASRRSSNGSSSPRWITGTFAVLRWGRVCWVPPAVGSSSSKSKSKSKEAGYCLSMLAVAGCWLLVAAAATTNYNTTTATTAAAAAVGMVPPCESGRCLSGLVWRVLLLLAWLWLWLACFAGGLGLGEALASWRRMRESELLSTANSLRALSYRRALAPLAPLATTHPPENIHVWQPWRAAPPSWEPCMYALNNHGKQACIRTSVVAVFDVLRCRCVR